MGLNCVASGNLPLPGHNYYHPHELLGLPLSLIYHNLVELDGNDPSERKRVRVTAGTVSLTV